MKVRKIFNNLQKELQNSLILLLIGSRQVGKTTVLKQLQKAIWDTKQNFFLNLEDPEIKKLLNTHPNKLFEITGSKPADSQIIFIDEIQYLDNPTNFLKYLYDEYKETVKLVVSGSSSFYIDQKFRDSLIGRKKVFFLPTLDFEEFLDFKGQNEVKDTIFIKKNIPTLQKANIERLFLEYITFWGYPEIVLMDSVEQKKERLLEYSQDFIKKDIYEANIQDQDKFFNILKILASQCGELVNTNELANTLNISFTTIEKYIYVMQKSFHIALMKPFYTNIRKELSKMPKVYFYDLGMRNAVLRNFDAISNRMDKGQYFENIVWRELVLTYWVENIKFWRTQSKNEVDFIVNESQAFEAKFSKNLIKESKYKLFCEQYPNIKLSFFTFEDFLKEYIVKRK